MAVSALAIVVSSLAIDGATDARTGWTGGALSMAGAGAFACSGMIDGGSRGARPALSCTRLLSAR